MTSKHAIPVAFLLALAGAAASAQTVYRCGDAYSQVPCAQAKAIDVSDARTAAQQTDAHRAAADERRLAAEMRRDRLADGHALKSTGAASLSGHAPVPKVAAAAPPHHPKKRGAAKPSPDADFVAYDPSTRKKRRRGA